MSPSVPMSSRASWRSWACEVTDDDFHHIPVMAELVSEIVAGAPAGLVVGATVGGGGHAERILGERDDIELLGLDRDPAAVAAATARLERFGDRATVRHARFDHIREEAQRVLVHRTGRRSVPGRGVSVVLFDLGVSSVQLDRPGRGFSFKRSGPLDMRMDPGQGRTAADIVNGESAEMLADIFDRYGDERFSRRIARRIVEERPITTTGQLADVVASAVPAATRCGRRHPATRTFQALRIEVNDELRLLDSALDDAIDMLMPGGRCIAMSYHSGEDRLVKSRFRDAETGGCECPDGLPCVCGAVPRGRRLKRGAWSASDDEIAENPAPVRFV